MSYATVADLREYLPQAKAGADTDTILQGILDSVSALIDAEIGHSWNTAATDTQTVYGDGTAYLKLPTYVAGTVTTVTTLASYTVPTYVEEDGYLVAVDSDGRKRYLYRGSFYADYDYETFSSTYTWRRGVPYTVTADFGYADPPQLVMEVCRQVAAHIYRQRDAGFATVIGVEGAGAVEVAQAYSPLVRQMLSLLNDSPASVGVR